MLTNKSNTQGTLADDGLPLVGVKASCTSHNQSLGSFCRYSARSVENIVTSGVNGDQGPIIKIMGRGYKIIIIIIKAYFL